MKRLIFTILLVFIGLTSWAASTKIGDLYYNLSLSSKTAEVTYFSYLSSSNGNYVSGAITIPAIVNYNSDEYSVTSIGSDAFYGCSDLISIEIPNSVSKIGYSAFSGCTSIKEVIIEDGETTLSIEYNFSSLGQFVDCPLETLHIGRNLSYSSSYDGGSPFANKSKLTTVTIGDKVTSLPNYLLYNCSGLISVEIPNSVMSIGNYAFNGCSSLSNVNFADGEKSISLGYNTNLSGSGKGLFADCPLETLHIGRNLSYSSGSSYGYSPVANQTELTEVTIGDKVTSLPNYLLYYCSGLTSVEIPNSVTSVGNSAFDGCRNLISIEIPNSVTSVEESTFYGCSGLTSIEIPSSVTSVGNSAFYGCSGLTSVTIGNSVTSIGNYAFYGCSGLTSVVIPNSVMSIGNYAFNGCSSLRNVNFVDGENSISLGYNTNSSGTGKGLFADCPLETLHIGRNLSYSSGSYDGRSPFANKSNLTTVTVGDKVTSLPNYLLYNCSGLTSIEIPSSVTSIGNSAFYGCSGLSSIEIPNSVTSIGGDAFYNCSGLTSVTIGNSVTSIGNYAFDGCSGLTSVVIPNSVMSIGNNAFNGCSSLSNVNFADGEKSISLGYNTNSSGSGKGLFADCPLETLHIGRNLSYNSGSSYGYSPVANQTELTEVTIGDKVTTLPAYCLYNCNALSSVEIPNSVTSIRGYAFSLCRGLTSVEIPNSVTSIENYAFYGCTSIRKVIIEDGETTLKLEYNSSSSSGHFVSCPLEILHIGRNLSYSSSYDGRSPFANQTELTTVTIGENVTSLPNYLLYNCSGLTSVEIPNSVTEIGNCAFNGCSSLKNVNFVDGENSISLGYNIYNSSGTGKGLFADCQLETLHIGRNYTVKDYSSTYPSSSYSSRYGYSPFANQTELTTVTIGENVTSLPNYLLYNCSGLTSVTIPNTVTSLGNYAFNGCSSLRNVNFVDGENSISLGYNTSSSGTGKGLFADCPLETLYIGRNLSYSSGSSYGYSPFANQTKLTTVTIDDKVTSLPNYLLYNCSGLTNVSIGYSVTSIGNDAFYGCCGLTSVEIPNSVTSIGSYAFYGCSGLISIEIPNSVTEIGNCAFNGCSSLKNVNFVDGENSISLGYNTYISSSSGTGKGLFADCPLETLYIGRNLSYSSGSSYGYSPFANQTKLTTVTIDDKVTSLPNYLLYNCSGLTSVEIPNSVSSIGSYAFFGCSGLTSIEIPNSVTSIGGDAFYNCSGLTSIEIPNSVTEIGNCAFNGCSSLKNVNFIDGENYISLGYNTYITSSSGTGKGLFADCPLETLHIGRNYTVKDYSSTYPSSSYSSRYGYSPFANQTELTTVTIGENVTSLPNYLLYNCSGLTSVEIPNSVTSIGDFSFSGCLSLLSVTIPATVSQIGEKAFYNCRAMESLTLTDGTDLLSLGGSAFGGLGITTLYVGRDIETANAFSGLSSLTSVTFANNLTLLGDYAFNGCSSLPSIELPNTLTFIGSYCFNGCTAMTTVTIPGSVTEIGRNAFYGCSNLEDITFSNGTTPISLGVSIFSNTLKTVTLSRNIASEAAFANQTGLTSVILTSNVTSLSPQTFMGDISLESITIPASVESIGGQCFASCTSLENVYYTPVESFASFEENTFPKATLISGNLVLTNTQKTIDATYNEFWSKFHKIFYQNGDTMFIPVKWDKRLQVAKAIYIADNGCIIPIDEEITFRGSGLNSVIHGGEDITAEILSDEGYSYSPDSNWMLNQFYCFGGNSDKIRSVTLTAPETLFDTIGLENIQMIEELTITGNINGTDVMTINRMSNLKYLNLVNANIVEGGQTYREGLKTENNVIGSEFLYDAKKIENLLLPSSVSLISKNAFNGCISMKNIIIGESTTSIGEGAFSNCSALDAIVIPASVISIQNNAFTGCKSLNSVVFEDGNEAITLGYATYNSSGTGKGLFGDSPLKKLYLGRDVSYYQNSSYPVTSYPQRYGYSPFYNQEFLVDLKIGPEVTTIRNYCFYSCALIPKLEIPESVTTIGDYAFCNCSSLESIVIEEGNKSLGLNAFNGCSSLLTCEIGNGQKTIGQSAFSDCVSLESFLMGEGTTIICPYAFSNCRKLKELQLPQGVSTIGDYAFSNCSSLEILEIPSSVLSMGSYAFKGCTSLSNLYLDENVEDDTWINGQYQVFSDWTSTNKSDGSSSSNTYRFTVNAGSTLSFTAWVDSEASYDYLKVSLNGSNIMSISGQSVTKSYSRTFTTTTEVSLVVSYSKDSSVSKYSDQGGIRDIVIDGSYFVNGLQLGTNGSSPYFEDCPIENLFLGRNLDYSEGANYGYAPFYGQSKLKNLTVGENVRAIRPYSFANCSSLETVFLPYALLNIENNAFQNCKSLSSIQIPDSITIIKDYVFDGCESLARLTIGANVKAISNTAFRNCSKIINIHSYALLPPVITHTVFEAVDKEACLLVVRKGRLVYYWTDPVWKEFLNLSDNMLEMNPLPAAKYGDPALDLAEYAPEGYTFTYESSNPEVAYIDGTMLVIRGAGEATVGVINDSDDGTPMALIGQLRQFRVEKADLNVSITPVEVYEGQPVPELELVFEGLCYDDTLDDIEEIPTASCKADSTSAPGEYPIVFSGGKDNNYNFVFADSKVIVKEKRKISITIPENVTYGEEPVDLSQYTPEGETVTYSLSDSGLAEVKDNILTIRGAGTVTILASLPEDTFDAMLVNPEITLTIDKADLTIKVQNVSVVVGEDIPEFVLTAEGLRYDDTLEDIDELPKAVCDAIKGSSPGIYTIYLEGGESENYNIILENGILTILDLETSITPDFYEGDNDHIMVVNYNGVILYDGPEADMGTLDPGIYIIVKGKESRKVVVK